VDLGIKKVSLELDWQQKYTIEILWISDKCQLQPPPEDWGN